MKQQIKAVIRCNYCGSAEQTVIFSDGVYSIVKCGVCQLAFLSPRPTKNELLALYDKEYFAQSHAGVGYTDYTLLADDLLKEAQQRLVLITSYIKKGRLLDAGCGYGKFLAEAKTNNFAVEGCDIADDAVKHIQEKYKIHAFRADILPNSLPKDRYNVITSWDVIEHMPDPKASLKAFYSAQKKNGYLFLTTPDIESIDARLLGKYWYGFKRIPEHVYYFSPQTIRKLLEAVGYTVVDIRTWGFQRNMAYCIQQVARYNGFIHTLLKPLVQWKPIREISFFFPFIDMFVIAQKK